MSFCATLQKKFATHFPKWRWEVVENANPSTSVIIMAQGMMIPGELILTIQDDAGRRLGQEVVGGQSYCD
ncbi:MAG: hypothetical protein HY301_11745, partial [Verrucomicrobia bacterium]|nr:hypothetical protein [Verrucomicrobiota bacterium]